MAKHKQCGIVAFDTWYAEHWLERWSSLREALLQPIKYLAWWNPWSTAEPRTVLPADASPYNGLDDYFQAESFEPPTCDHNGLFNYYLLDGASAMIAPALALQAHHSVVDLCAAPGGKMLQIAAHVAEHGEIIANDASPQRQRRLLRVIRDYLPTDLVDRVRVTNRDAQRWCLYEQNRFDRVLLDAPCSSERHLLTNSAAMNEWTPARSRQLAMRQYAMLVSALDIVKIGGLIAYCTCSISPLECDDVISRLVKRRPHRFRILKPELPCPCEYTKHGVYFLPDYCQWGPLYFSLIERLA